MILKKKSERFLMLPEVVHCASSDPEFMPPMMPANFSWIPRFCEVPIFGYEGSYYPVSVYASRLWFFVTVCNNSSNFVTFRQISSDFVTFYDIKMKSEHSICHKTTLLFAYVTLFEESIYTNTDEILIPHDFDNAQATPFCNILIIHKILSQF